MAESQVRRNSAVEVIVTRQNGLLFELKNIKASNRFGLRFGGCFDSCWPNVGNKPHIGLGHTCYTWHIRGTQSKATSEHRERSFLPLATRMLKTDKECIEGRHIL